MGRPRGFANWNPADETQALLANVEQVLDEYADHLPLTVRQIFYRLVGQYDYDKTERAYSRLGEHLVRARRAGLIPFAAIRDDGTIASVPRTFGGVDAFWADVRERSSYYVRDRMASQDVAVELWCEAAGMVPQLRRVAFEYSVPVYSTGGFSSVTVTNEIAQRALTAEVPTVFMHVGDYDPSGQSIFEAMATDAGMFVTQVRANIKRGEPVLAEALGIEDPQDVNHFAELRPRRVALTEQQVADYDLPTAPPKRSDSRSANWDGDTCQLEAMPPDELANVVRAAIESELNMDAYHSEVNREDEDRVAIDEALDSIT